MLPMEPTIGKMLVMGSILGCLEPVLTIAAGLSLKDPFVSPIDKRDVRFSTVYFAIGMILLIFTY